MEKQTVSLKLKCAYRITSETHKALALAGTPVNIIQHVTITVDAAQAIERGLARMLNDGSFQQCGGGFGRTMDGLEYSELIVLEHGMSCTHRSPYESDHVLTVEEATSTYEASAERTTRLLAAEAASAKAKEEAARAEKARILAELVATVERDLPALEAGYGIIDTGFPYFYELDGRRVNLRNRGDGIEAPKEACETVQRVRVARDEAEAKAKAEAKTKATAERDAWIATHGSDRLKKGLATGMIDKMHNVYRDERIKCDLGPDWIAWQAAPEPCDNDRTNPSEAELDALMDARAKWPGSNAQLLSVGGEDKRGGEHPWRPAIMIDCSWDEGESAICYIDAGE